MPHQRARRLVLPASAAPEIVTYCSSDSSLGTTRTDRRANRSRVLRSHIFTAHFNLSPTANRRRRSSQAINTPGIHRRSAAKTSHAALNDRQAATKQLGEDQRRDAYSLGHSEHLRPFVVPADIGAILRSCADAIIGASNNCRLLDYHRYISPTLANAPFTGLESRRYFKGSTPIEAETRPIRPFQCR